MQNCTAQRLREAVDDSAKADQVIGDVRNLLAEFDFTLKEG